MPEIVLRLRVWDHSGAKLSDTIWQKHLEVGFLPAVGDDVQLWGIEDGPAAPVTQRWWRPDGRTVVRPVDLIINSPQAANPVGKDGRLQWVPWSWHQGLDHPGALLRTAGWEVRTDA